MHLVRYYGGCANRTRRGLAEARVALAHGGAPAPEAPSDPGELLPPDVSFEDKPPPLPPGSAAALARQSWARLLRKVFEVDPLVCPRCGAEMEVVACIAEAPKVGAGPR